jgi:hypothetical protein
MGLTRKEKRKKERRRIIAFFESLLSFMSWKRIEEEEKKKESGTCFVISRRATLSALTSSVGMALFGFATLQSHHSKEEGKKIIQLKFNFSSIFQIFLV